MGTSGCCDDPLGLGRASGRTETMSTSLGFSRVRSVTGRSAAQVIPLTVFELGGFEGVVDVMGYITFSYWFLDLAGPRSWLTLAHFC